MQNFVTFGDNFETLSKHGIILGWKKVYPSTKIEHNLTTPLEIMSDRVQTASYAFWIDLFDASDSRISRILLERYNNNKTNYEVLFCTGGRKNSDLLLTVDLPRPLIWTIARTETSLSLYLNADRVFYLDLDQHESSVCVRNLANQIRISFSTADMYSTYYRARPTGMTHMSPQVELKRFTPR